MQIFMGKFDPRFNGFAPSSSRRIPGRLKKKTLPKRNPSWKARFHRCPSAGTGRWKKSEMVQQAGGNKKTGSEEPVFSSLLDKSAFMMKWAPFSFNQETTPRRLNQVCCYAQLLITKNDFFYALDQFRSASM
jgi:hypothetical protein